MDKLRAEKHQSDKAETQSRRGLPKILNVVSIPLLRWSLGFIYVWFGSLKILGMSPVADLVAKALAPIPSRASVPLVGILELVIGAGLMARTALRAILALFFLQLGGTFIVLLRRPREIFQKGNPLLLTQEGEFLLKNLVLLSAGLVVATRARGRDEKIDR